MATSFYKNYYKYFLWNKALINHFFSKDKENILFYVDKQLLEDIGKKEGIDKDCNEEPINDYREDFFNSVENFCNNYLNLHKPLSNSKKLKNIDIERLFACELSSFTCNQRNKCTIFNTSQKGCTQTDPLIVINNIIDKGLKYYNRHETESGEIKVSLIDNKAQINELPFLAIVIYVILKFDNGNTQEWENVNNCILAVKAPSRSYIPKIWETIYNYDQRFDKEASIYDRSNSSYGDYAGKILYHLPLSASTRNKIYDAIYKSSVWKVVDTKSFVDLVSLIMRSLEGNKANKELNNILQECLTSNDTKGISARKVQTIIDDFDIDTYKKELIEKRKQKDYNQTLISGEFALGIHFPYEDEGAENSIVLLTTVQQELNENEFIIREGGSGTLAGYNTHLVKYRNSTNVEIKEYSLKNNKYNITSLVTDEIVFFYEYDETLYIQTEEIKPAKSYIIAVKKGCEEKFELWCTDNQNKVAQWDIEVTSELFGVDWTIFYTEKRLNGQYYDKYLKSKKIVDNSSSIIMKGGIKKTYNTYYINALPYFEIPDNYNIENIKVYANLNGSILEEYQIIINDRKIILDIPDMPVDNKGTAYMDICLECDKHTKFSFEINVCGQAVNYSTNHIYGIDWLGNINSDNNIACTGNKIKENYKATNIRGVRPILHKKDFSSLTDDLYFTNLLAACCFGSENSEITHAKFRKCISYAATRLNIDIQHENFISNVKKTFSRAGILQVDYSNNKYQAIAPFFMRIPFSTYQVNGTQLLMLSGCYTRSFIADLKKYCKDSDIDIFRIDYQIHNDEEKLLPPIILLGHNFNPTDFCKKYDHQCDVLSDHDFALSLLNMIPSNEKISSLFVFKHESDKFTSLLDPAKTNILPRIRSITTNITSHKKWYIEEKENMYAEIGQNLLSWASVYCLQKQATPLIGIKESSVYLPKTLLLPFYVQRALYLMNLGLSEVEKVFICESSGTSYFTNMERYNLHTIDRCNIFASKIVGTTELSSSKLIKSCVNTSYKMELWRSALIGRKKSETYLILKNNDSILAIAHQHTVYLNCKGIFRKIIANSVNEAMTFLIKNNWKFLQGSTSIGYSINYGDSFKPVFKISHEKLLVPKPSNYKIEPIKII